MERANQTQKIKIFSKIFEMCCDENNLTNYFRIVECYDDMENQLIQHCNYDMDDPYVPGSPIQTLFCEFHIFCSAKNPKFKCINPLSNVS